MSPLLNSPLRRGELTPDFVLYRGYSLKFIPFISSNSRYIIYYFTAFHLLKPESLSEHFRKSAFQKTVVAEIIPEFVLTGTVDQHV